MKTKVRRQDKRRTFTSKNAQQLRHDALSMLAKSNATSLPERKVSPATALEVVSRDLEKTRGREVSHRTFSALRSLSSFLSLTTRDKATTASLQYSDLLPVGHPRSTKTHSMTASGLRHAQARWIAADPLIDEEVRSLVATAHSLEPGSIQRQHAFARLEALQPGLVPLTASIDTESLVAGLLSFVGGNSKMARSLRAQMQRRDRYGRFAFMGGGFSFKIKNIDGTFNVASGRVVGRSPGDGDGIEVELPDGARDSDGNSVLRPGIYTVPSSKGTAVKAILSAEAVKDLPTRDVGTDDVFVDKKDLTPRRLIEGPTGWTEKKKGITTFDEPFPAVLESADGYVVRPIRESDQTTDVTGYELSRKELDFVDFPEMKSWADVQKAILKDQKQYEKDIKAYNALDGDDDAQAKFVESRQVPEARGKVEEKGSPLLESRDSYEEQISDAIDAGEKIEFEYEGDDVEITPSRIDTDDAGKKTVVGADAAGEEKSFDLDSINSEVEDAGEPEPKSNKNPVNNLADSVWRTYPDGLYLVGPKGSNKEEDFFEVSGADVYDAKKDGYEVKRELVEPGSGTYKSVRRYRDSSGNTSDLGDFETRQELTSQIKSAYNKGDNLRFTYKGSEKLVQPSKIYQNKKTGKWNMVGWSVNDNEERTYSLDSVKPAKKAAAPLPGEKTLTEDLARKKEREERDNAKAEAKRARDKERFDRLVNDPDNWEEQRVGRPATSSIWVYVGPELPEGFFPPISYFGNPAIDYSEFFPEGPKRIPSREESLENKFKNTSDEELESRIGQKGGISREQIEDAEDELARRRGDEIPDRSEAKRKSENLRRLHDEWLGKAVNPPETKPVTPLNPSADTPLRKQVEDAIENNDTVAFFYNGTDREVDPTRVWTNPKNGNENLTGTERSGVEKNFTFDRIEAPKAEVQDRGDKYPSMTSEMFEEIKSLAELAEKIKRKKQETKELKELYDAFTELFENPVDGAPADSEQRNKVREKLNNALEAGEIDQNTYDEITGLLDKPDSGGEDNSGEAYRVLNRTISEKVSSSETQPEAPEAPDYSSLTPDQREKAEALDDFFKKLDDVAKNPPEEKYDREDLGIGQPSRDVEIEPGEGTSLYTESELGEHNPIGRTVAFGDGSRGVAIDLLVSEANDPDMLQATKVSVLKTHDADGNPIDFKSLTREEQIDLVKDYGMNFADYGLENGPNTWEIENVEPVNLPSPFNSFRRTGLYEGIAPTERQQSAPNTISKGDGVSISFPLAEYDEDPEGFADQVRRANDLGGFVEIDTTPTLEGADSITVTFDKPRLTPDEARQFLGDDSTDGAFDARFSANDLEREELFDRLTTGAGPSGPTTPSSTPGDGRLPDFLEDAFDEMFEVPDGSHKLNVFDDYSPRGRTDEASSNYTDDPEVLSQMFSDRELTIALSQALVSDDEDGATGFGSLEFDEGDESVPAEALYSALQRQGVDADRVAAMIYDAGLDPSRSGANMRMYNQRADDLKTLAEEPKINAVPLSSTEQRIMDARKDNGVLGIPTKAQAAVDLLKDYDEQNPKLLEVAELIKNAVPQDLDEEYDRNIDQVFSWAFSDDKDERDAFSAFWGMMLAIEGGDSDMLDPSGDDSIDGGIRSRIRQSLRTSFEDMTDTELQDRVEEIIDNFGTFADLVAGKARIAEGVDDLDSGSTAANFFRLVKATAVPNDRPLYRSIGVSKENRTLLEQYTTEGNVIAFDPRSFTYQKIDTGDYFDSIFFPPGNYDDPRVIFVANEGDVDASSIDPLSWIDEGESLVYGQYEVVSTRRQPSGDARRTDEYVVQIRRTNSTPQDLAEQEMPDEAPLEVYDTAGWVKTGGQLGSNPGGFYEDANGNGYYVKVPKSQSHAENEVLASVFYEELGVPAAQVRLGADNGNVRIVSKLIPDANPDLADKVSDNDEEYLNKLRADFAVDSWLSNYDVTGTGWDNVVTDASGNPVRVDPGGALMWRAQGKPKEGMFGNEVSEIDGLRDPDLNYYGSTVFGTMTDDDVRESAKKLISMTPSRIDSIVDSVITSPEDAAYIKDRLKNRRQYILDRFDLTGDEDADLLQEPIPLTNSIGFAAQDLQPGDVLGRDSFVIERVFRDEKTKPGKVSIEGYYAGHVTQRKEYGETDVIDAARGSTTPQKGDNAPIVRPKKPTNPTPPAFSGAITDELRDAQTWEEAAAILRDREIVFFDYETTGFPDYNTGELNTNQPVQLGAVKVRNGEVIDRFNMFMDPMEELGTWSRENLKDENGNPLTDEFLVQQAGMGDVHSAFIDWAGPEAIFGAHNTPFDSEVFNRVLAKENLDYAPAGYVDTLKFAREIVSRRSAKNPDGPASHKLGDLSDHYNLELADWHTADADSEATSKLFYALIDDATVRRPETASTVLDTEARTAEFEQRKAEYEAELEKYKKELADYTMQKAIAAAWNCGGAGITAAVGPNEGPCDVPSVDDLINDATFVPGENSDPEAVTSGDTKNPSNSNETADTPETAEQVYETPAEPLGVVEEVSEDAMASLNAKFDEIRDFAEEISDSKEGSLKKANRDKMAKALEELDEIRQALANGDMSSEEAVARLGNILETLPRSGGGNVSDEQIDIDVFNDLMDNLRDQLSGFDMDRPYGEDLPPKGSKFGYDKNGVFIKPGAKVMDKWGYVGAFVRYNTTNFAYGYFNRDLDGYEGQKSVKQLTVLPDDEDRTWIYDPKIPEKHRPENWKDLVPEGVDVEEKSSPKGKAPKGASKKDEVPTSKVEEVLTEPLPDAETSVDTGAASTDMPSEKDADKYAESLQSLYDSADFGIGSNQNMDDALLYYQQEGYDLINKILRGKPLPSNFDATEVTVTMAGMTELFNTAPALPEDTVLYRGLNSEYADEIFDSYGVDDIFRDGGYSSTSLASSEAEDYSSYDGDKSPEEARRVVLEIVAPAGTRAVYVPGFLGDSADYVSEREVLLDAGTTFRVISKTQDPDSNIRRMRVAIVDQDNKIETNTTADEPETLETPKKAESLALPTGTGVPPVVVDQPRGFDYSDFDEVPSLRGAVEKIQDPNIKNAKAIGASTLVDGGDIEDLEVHVDGIIDTDGEEKMRLTFKLTSWADKPDLSYVNGWTDLAASEGLDRIGVQKSSIDESTGAIKLQEKVEVTLDRMVYNKVSSAEDFDPRMHVTEIDKAKITYWNEYSGAYANQVSIVLPYDATDEQIKKAMEVAGVKEPRAATKEDMKVLIENRLMSIFMGQTDATKNPSNEMRRNLLDSVKRKFEVTADDVEIRTGVYGQIEMLLPQEVADKIAVKTGAEFLLHELSVHNAILSLKIELGNTPSQKLEGVSVLDEIARKVFDSGIIKQKDPSLTDEENIDELSGSEISRMAEAGLAAIVLSDMLSGPLGGGLLSTRYRFNAGMQYEGLSSVADMTSGGADYVFLRPSDVRSADSAISSDYSTTVELSFDTSTQYRRLDWYSNYHDDFGARNPNRDVISEAKPGAYEVMFKRRLGFDALERVTTGKFIADLTVLELKNRGVNEISGVPVESMISYPGKKLESPKEPGFVSKLKDKSEQLNTSFSNVGAYGIDYSVFIDSLNLNSTNAYLDSLNEPKLEFNKDYQVFPPQVMAATKDRRTLLVRQYKSGAYELYRSDGSVETLSIDQLDEIMKSIKSGESEFTFIGTTESGRGWDYDIDEAKTQSDEFEVRDTIEIILNNYKKEKMIDPEKASKNAVEDLFSLYNVNISSSYTINNIIYGAISSIDNGPMEYAKLLAQSGAQ